MGHFSKDPIKRFLHMKKYILADASLIYKDEKNKKKWKIKILKQGEKREIKNNKVKLKIKKKGRGKE